MANSDVREMTSAEVAAMEEILGHKFNNQSLMLEALTHPSYSECPNYDLLEFVGDAILKLLISREVFAAYPHLERDTLTLLRDVSMDTEKLARIAVKHGLHSHLRHRSPLLEDQIQKFAESILEHPTHSNGFLVPPKALAKIVKSLLGAVFKENNESLETVGKVFQRLAEPFINEETIGKHAVTELYELCRKRGMQLRFVNVTWMENTMVKVLIDDNLVGSAIYDPKKEIALYRAAKDALDKLKGKSAELDLTLLSIAG